MDQIYLKCGETYIFNIFNRFFSEHLPIISTSAVGGVTVGEVISGVTTTWKSSTGKIFEGNITGAVTDLVKYDTTNDLKVYTTSYSTSKDQIELQKIKIQFTPSTVGIYYLQDAREQNLGIQLTVLATYGDFINPEEVYSTLLMRRSNRIYSYDYQEDLLNKFLNKYIPAGLLTRVTNLPPIFNEWDNDKVFYNPTDLAILSVDVTDPENDILTYKWEHVGIRCNSGVYTTNSVAGSDLTVSILNDESLICSGVLTTPPVETLYTFQLLCSDTDNTTSGLNQIPVYSTPDTLKFTNWGVTSFYLGDNDLPFNYY